MRPRLIMLASVLLTACSYRGGVHAAHDPASALTVEIDRFSDAYAYSFRRSQDPSLPAPNQAIAFDTGRFMTRALGPHGEHIVQYNFDARGRVPIPIYHAVRASTGERVVEQPSIVDILPGDAGANDLWQVVNVLVPDDFVPNTLTSLDDILASPYDVESTRDVVNCPPVPAGSTANLRYDATTPTELQHGWYKDQIFHYFTFGVRALEVADGGIPISTVFVALKTDPQPNAALGDGPPAGWVTESADRQTHNIVASLPDELTYSPLWSVDIYAMAEFASVVDLQSAEHASLLSKSAAILNWPIVAVTADP